MCILLDRLNIFPTVDCNITKTFNSYEVEKYHALYTESQEWIVLPIFSTRFLLSSTEKLLYIYGKA